MKTKKILMTLLISLFFFTGITTSAQVKVDSINYEWGSKTYPGIQPGEVFLTVISDHAYYDENSRMFIMTYPSQKQFTLIKNYNEISWKTKRLGFGLIAYGPHGNVLPGFRPVFVQESELIKAGLLK